ncbi:MAG TPA: hypothetical protein DCX67_00180, partial [Opitutae bacterium]|nr:hypothetical protein [Opitutae bacterium]
MQSGQPEEPQLAVAGAVGEPPVLGQAEERPVRQREVRQDPLEVQWAHPVQGVQARWVHLGEEAQARSARWEQDRSV